MPFAQGEILVLPFPYSDKLAEKRRPAVVVSKPALERGHKLLWVAMITSDRGVRRPHDVPIADLPRAGLPAASIVRPVKLATIEPSRVLRSAGTLTRADLTMVLEALRKLI
ncbi:MAG TPA: type II toxin-antitoxin system PemK/MazF family toxin [Vitreimonas sp.]|uniref:type II toxin-antitoxin system PemK/MazF family toxin n=1 Tax=Vitreimonas sp. TaxID=3069702 RepID=UPI002D690E5A|nr:type II toxin-antitoxin system PemK/MazF family toxin [Vitreimonas sp.]HYD87051.1 type II toxin-antitoxin system PemK/MazF family toxin [Vitreimonas sp.]